jgi:beta-N-acetylhexosaminidase
MPAPSGNDPRKTEAHSGRRNRRTGFLRWLPVWLALGIALALACLLNSPLTAGFRPLDRYLAFGIPLAVAAGALAVGRPAPGKRCPVGQGMLLVCVVVTVWVACRREGRFHHQRQRILSARPGLVSALGRHVVAGFTASEEITALARRGAVGGVYLTRRNVSGKTAGQIAAGIRALQAVRSEHGLPPLLVCADHEGGMVSRLSPPLTRLRPLGDLLSDPTPNADLRQAVARYAQTHARELASVGVNVNLGPVVDLRPTFTPQTGQDRTRLPQRAISSDPERVLAVALPYCKVLRGGGVIPTLKHFPGLGRVRQDTHLQLGELAVSPAVLAGRDWRPFEAILARTDAFLMMGHVRIESLDREQPASLSKAIVQGIVRGKWRHDGILITDDLNMAPAFSGSGGIGAAAVRALNAGVDLLLVSYDSRQYYAVMAALLDADAEGALDRRMLGASGRRLARVAAGLRMPANEKSAMVATKPSTATRP